MRNLIWLAVLLAAPFVHSFVVRSLEADTIELKSESLTVDIDDSFPLIVQYRHNKTGATFDGQKSPVSTINFNGQAAPCDVKFRKLNDSSAEYRLQFQKQQVTVTLKVTVGESAVKMAVTDVREKGKVKLKSIAFPGNALLSLDSSSSNAQIAATFCAAINNNAHGVFREEIAQLSSFDAGQDTGNYFFLSDGKLAAGIASNHYVDIKRTAYKISEANGVKTCVAWCPEWAYREIETETVELPCVTIFITADRNGDGRATWQDGAIAYRENMPKPFGSEYVKTTVGENIAMNFASGAQQPFLRILDEVKKIYRATDGIGNQVVIKGFSAEGHDSANTDCGGHYNERAGGLKDINILLEQAKKYNCRVGFHINASEVYPEAHRYDPEILKRRNGNLVGGWAWLDHAVMLDKHKDITSGKLFASLDQMKKEVPGLDFVYVDTYWSNGWPAMKLAKKLRSIELAFYTEGDMPLDPWTTWAHWRYTKSKVMHFIWYSDRDIFKNDSILRGGRNVSDGFMAWQSRHDFNTFIRGTFSRHLPTKYLKHFELLRWEPEKSADFSDGVKVVKTGQQVTVTRNGRTVMTWKDGGSQSRLFVPWDPIKESKIYVWDELGTDITWELPVSWRESNEVYLYKLTDEGRTEESKVSVTNGQVTLKPEKNTPYVIYRAKASGQKCLDWGEGSLVRDPGFDSYGFRYWKPGPVDADTGHLSIKNDNNRNARLVISGNNGAAAEVSQIMAGLKPGRLYAASVWVQVEGKRTASIEVLPLGKEGLKPVFNYVTSTNVRHGMPCDPRKGTNYQRLKVLFDMPTGCTESRISLKAAKGSPGTLVEFDDVRVVETKRSPETARHWFYEDFENVDMGYGPFTCCFDEHTHLSETNKPYTKDTINGKFSLKTRGKGRIVRTLPSTVRFKPWTRYRLACQTLASPGGDSRVTVECRDGLEIVSQKISQGRGEISVEFSTFRDEESFMALFKEKGDWLVIDDIIIDELGSVPEGQRIDMRAGPFKPANGFISTCQGEYLYLHLMDSRNSVFLPSIQHKIIEARLLNGKGDVFVKQAEKYIEVTIPEDFTDEIESIVMLKIDGDATLLKPRQILSPFEFGTHGQWISKDAVYKASSIDNQWSRREEQLLTGEDYEGAHSFHTRQEMNPYIVIDLKKDSNVKAFEITNRKDGHYDRARTLAVWISSDQKNWQQVWRAKRAQKSWEAILTKDNPDGVKGRYVKIGLLGKTCFHLYSVKIYGNQE